MKKRKRSLLSEIRSGLVKTEQHCETPRSKYESDVCDAYAEACKLTALLPENEQYKRRNLQFTPGKEFGKGSRIFPKISVAAFERIAKTTVPGGYNDFDPKRVASVLRRYGPVCVQFGREYSPVLYVHGPIAALDKIRKAKRSLRADEAEYSFAGTRKGKTMSNRPRGGTLRLWWD